MARKSGISLSKLCFGDKKLLYKNFMKKPEGKLKFIFEGDGMDIAVF